MEVAEHESEKVWQPMKAAIKKFLEKIWPHAAWAGMVSSGAAAVWFRDHPIVLFIAIAIAMLIVGLMLGSGFAKRSVAIYQQEYSNLTEAVPAIEKIIRGSDRPIVNIDILASDGGSIVDFLRNIETTVRDLSKQFVVTIRMVNEDSPLIDKMPPWWKQHVVNHTKRIMALNSSKMAITILLYDYVPCVAGLMVNDDDLFLSFYSWKQTNDPERPDIDAAQQPHIHYVRNVTTKKYFTLFAGWLRLAPKVKALGASA